MGLYNMPTETESDLKGPKPLHIHLFVNLHPSSLNSPLLKKWLTRKDGVMQRYSAAFLPPEEAPDYSSVPEPKRTQLLTGTLETRVQFAAAYLRSRHPSAPERGKVGITVCRTDAELRQYCQEQGLAYHRVSDADAVYVYDLHAIVIRPRMAQLLNSQDGREWAAGVYLLAHEWFHAMRRPEEPFNPLEEGGAEVFAARVAEQMTGTTHPSLAVHAYRYQRLGVLRLGQAALGQGRASQWAEQSRVSGDQQQWMKNC